MLSPFLVLPSPEKLISHLPFPSQPSPASLSWYFSTLKHLSRTKGLSSLWCLTRLSSAADVSGATGNSMCPLWLKVLSLGALGVLDDSYYCSSFGAANPFSSLGPFSSSSIGDPVLSSMVGWECPTLYFSCTSRASQVTAISGPS